MSLIVGGWSAWLSVWLAVCLSILSVACAHENLQALASASQSKLWLHSSKDTALQVLRCRMEKQPFHGVVGGKVDFKSLEYNRLAATFLRSSGNRAVPDITFKDLKFKLEMKDSGGDVEAEVSTKQPEGISGRCGIRRLTLEQSGDRLFAVHKIGFFKQLLSTASKRDEVVQKKMTDQLPTLLLDTFEKLLASNEKLGKFLDPSRFRYPVIELNRDTSIQVMSRGSFFISSSDKLRITMKRLTIAFEHRDGSTTTGKITAKKDLVIELGLKGSRIELPLDVEELDFDLLDDEDEGLLNAVGNFATAFGRMTANFIAPETVQETVADLIKRKMREAFQKLSDEIHEATCP